MAEYTSEEITFPSPPPDPSGSPDAETTTLAGTIFRPSAESTGLTGVVVLHGFPAPTVGVEKVGDAYVSMAERITETLGVLSLACTNRGCGSSGGHFSVAGWREDACAAIAEMGRQAELNHLFVVGFGTGAAMAISAAADNPDVSGVAAFGPPADFSDWAADPRQLLAHCRQLGLISNPDFPADFEAWASEIKSVNAAKAASGVAPRPLLLVHGDDDEIVPVFDTRVIADAHGSAELRLLEGAGHGLRFDPRAVAILLGWLDRQSLS